jgi:hypothetical protein
MPSALVIALVLATSPFGDGDDLEDTRASVNVPESADFYQVLARDLATHFPAALVPTNDPRNFELLGKRPGSGSKYLPQFCFWVRLADGKSPDNRGVLVVIAHRKRFEFQSFDSERALRADKHRLRTFPTNVRPKIKDKLGRKPRSPAGK